MRAWGLADGDIGYEYWEQVSRLLKAAHAMARQVAELQHEVAEL